MAIRPPPVRGSHVTCPQSPCPGGWLKITGSGTMPLHDLTQALTRHSHASSVSRCRRGGLMLLPMLSAVSLAVAGILQISPSGFSLREGLSFAGSSIGKISATARAAALRPQNATPVTTVSAASYEGSAIAPESIVAAFGTQLATQTALATTTPLPTSLGGTTVEINGQAAQLFFVSAGQINFVIPAGTASGTANVVVHAGNGITSNGTVQVKQAGPAVFSANADGSGVPAALALRVKTNNEQIYESVSQLNTSTGRLVTKPIDLGPEGERVFLVLFLSGIRKAPDPNGDQNVNESIRVVIGGTEVIPDYAGRQPDFAGLDQINLEIPRSLIGRGKIDISVPATGFGSSNLGEIEIAGAPGSVIPTVSSFGSPNVLASQTLTINGSGFSGNPADNTVRIAGTEADINSASSTQLSVTVPFGVETGSVSVRTQQGEGISSNSLPVRTSISGFIEDTNRQPMSGVTVRYQGGSPITTTTNSEGLFILPDVPAGAAIVEMDATDLTSPPYPKLTLKKIVTANRDNQFSQPVAMQQSTGPGLSVGTGGDPAGGTESAESAQEVTGSIQTGNVILDIPPGSATFPNGATGGIITLTLLENSRTPTGLPAGFFSSAIAQITPFGVILNPG